MAVVQPRRCRAGAVLGRSLVGGGRALAGVGDDAAVLLQRNSSSEDLAATLANDMGEADVPIAIVIDDFHRAPRTPAVFGSLVSMLPSNVRMVIGTRVDPPLPLGRLRVAGSLLELHSDDLCFSPAETAAALELNGVATDPKQVSRLHDLTEGWPAGVQLATMAMRQATDHGQFLDAFAATDRAVAEFLVDEVLNSLDSDLVEFLYPTSVLEEFDATLCEDVTGNADAARLLDRLVAHNLFVVRLDVGNGWYRYHHLFGAFLRARLRALGGSRWRDAHERAATAMEARGNAVAALQQATAGGNAEQSAAIVGRTLDRWMNVVDPETSSSVVRWWLDRYGREFVVTDPEQVLLFILATAATVNPDDSVWWFNHIDQTHPSPTATVVMTLQGVWAEHFFARGQAEEALVRVRAALNASVGMPLEGIRSGLPTLLARVHLLLGDTVAAAEVLAATERQPTGHPVTDNVRVPSLQGLIALQNGDIRRAEQRARASIASADQMGLAPSDAGRIFAGITLAGIALERLDDETAHEQLVQTGHGAELGGRPPLQSLVALHRSIVARVTGDEESAAAGLHLARHFLPVASPAVRKMFDVEAAYQAIQFRPLAAPALIDALGDDARAPLLRIRLALAHGDLGTAAGFLDRLPPAIVLRDRVVRNTLVALTSIDRDVESATAAFTAALLEAQSEGLRRTVIDIAPDVLRLLMSVTPTRDLESYVDELINAATTVPAALRPRAVTSLVEQLSEREVTVLRYLCSRLTYQEIASALYVSLNTLKSHVKSVYRKLGVASRREAVEVGRELHLV